MALVHALSAKLTNLNAVPQVRNTSGIGDRGALQVEEAVVAIAGQADILSTYQLFRIPSNAKVKRVELFCPDTGTTGKIDVGAFYGPNGPVGKVVTPPTTAGVSLIDKDFFLQAVTVSGTGGGYAMAVPGGGFTLLVATPALIAGGGGWTSAVANKELWDALGIATDPKCDIDIVASLNEAVDTGAVSIWSRIEYII